jgi:hypothetical protein
MTLIRTFFPNLYKIAHREWAVDKSNNSTSGFPQLCSLHRELVNFDQTPPFLPAHGAV